MYSTRNFLLLFFLCARLCAPVPVAASDALPASAETPHVRVEYFLHNNAPLAALYLDLPVGSHIYAHDAGAGARPAVLRIRDAAGRSLPVLYPPGIEQRIPGFSVPVRVNGSTAIFFVFLRPQGIQTLSSVPEGALLAGVAKTAETVEAPGEADIYPCSGTLAFVLCSGRQCMPHTLELSLHLPKERLIDVAQSSAAEAFKAARPGQPESAESEISADLQRRLNRADGAEQAASLPILGFSPLVSVAAETPGEAGGVVPGEKEQIRRFAPRVFQNTLEVSGLVPALALGFCAGVLLNLMPCVLPVLFLKFGVFLRPDEGEDASRARRLREHMLFFAAGIMTWFFALALLLGTAGLVWGQLFQQPALIYSLTILVFMLGLSALGVFTLPLIDLKVGHASSPRMQAFFMGFLATLLATPCSGPLLGGVLAWAFTQSSVVLLAVFSAVGAGMAAPYLLFAALPDTARLLPRPGPWLEVLERLLGFFLMGLAVYLLSLLPEERRMPALFALALIAPAAWIWGRWCGPATSGVSERRRALLKMTGAALTTIGLFVGAYKVEIPVYWEDFNPQEFYAALGVQPIMLVFTADWCPNCKALEHAVLRDEYLRAWRERYDLRFIRVDLTREDTERMSLLRALGSAGIPFTALFPPGAQSARPLVLRDIYSKRQLEEALEQSFGEASR